MICFKNFTPEQIAVTATALAIALTRDKDIAELNAMLNFTNTLYYSMRSIVVQQDIQKLLEKELDPDKKKS